jgi:hypothetical protein
MAKAKLRLVAPTTVNRTVTPRRPPNAELRTREHLTPAGSGGPDRGRRTEPPGSARRSHGASDLSARLASGRSRGPALGASRLQDRVPACPQGQERHAKHAPADGQGATGVAQAPKGKRQVALRVRFGARCAVIGARFLAHDRACVLAAKLGIKAHAHMLRQRAAISLRMTGSIRGDCRLI